jgi:hypothetical protein
MTPEASVAHRVPLDGTTWSVWRDVGLRSAGFPADMMLDICDEDLARSADIAGAYDVVYPDAARRLCHAIADIAADPAFKEALTWQNPTLARFLENAGVGRLARRSKDRQRELVIASYLQRYCLKNDTIGFFGPVGWACADPGTPGLVVTPGNQLIARRTTYFEVWAIDKVAAAIAGQGRVAGWLQPRWTRSVFLDGNVLHRPHRKPVILTDAEVRILLACDGSATISDVLASAGVPEARILLARLAELGALRMDLEGPMHAWPERLLMERLDRIADPVARAAAVEPVERMIRARDTVAASAGDAAELRQVLADLAETFEEVTGSAATRRAGELYAGRTLVYQDAVRDVRVELGAAVTGALAGPLGLVLDSARWLVNEIAERYRVLFGELLDHELARAAGEAVPLQRLLTAASPYLSFGSGRGLTEIAAACTAELQRRWQEVLGPPASASRHQVSADAIAASVAACFPGRPVAWSSARQHSPDIMIAAASPGDVQRGNFLLVLGEVHVTCNTLEARLSVEQHPEPATVMPAAAMTVSRRGGDLVVRLMPSGAELDFFEVVGEILTGLAGNAFQPAAPAAHQPRITIDKLVLSREQWVFQVPGSGWAFVRDEQERYYFARRWRQEHQLPERVFLRVPVEAKPVAVDFRSIVLVNLLAKHIRQTEAAGHTEFSVSEMLPDLDQLWLADHAGRRYSSELRFVAFDGMVA